MAKYKIEQLKEENLPEVVRINHLCQKDSYSDFLSENYFACLNFENGIRWRKEYYFQTKENEGKLYAIFANDEMIAYLGISKADSFDSQNALEINEIFVLKKYRGKGLSIRLLKRMLADLAGFYSNIIIYNYTESESNSFYKYLEGNIIRRDIQQPDGTEKAVDIFSWKITAFQKSKKN